MLAKYNYTGVTDSHFTNGNDYYVLTYTGAGAVMLDDNQLPSNVSVGDLAGADWTLLSITTVGVVSIYP